MISLIRGGNSLFPCPICLVPKDSIPELSKVHDLRTTKEMQDIWKKAQTLRPGECEELLKKYGLRNVEVRL